MFETGSVCLGWPAFRSAWLAGSVVFEVVFEVVSHELRLTSNLTCEGEDGRKLLVLLPLPANC